MLLQLQGKVTNESRFAKKEAQNAQKVFAHWICHLQDLIALTTKPYRELYSSFWPYRVMMFILIKTSLIAKKLQKGAQKREIFSVFRFNFVEGIIVHLNLPSSKSRTQQCKGNYGPEKKFRFWRFNYSKKSSGGDLVACKQSLWWLQRHNMCIIHLALDLYVKHFSFLLFCSLGSSVNWPSGGPMFYASIAK